MCCILVPDEHHPTERMLKEINQSIIWHKPFFKNAWGLGMFDGLWGREGMSAKVQLVLGMEELSLWISSYLDTLDPVKGFERNIESPKSYAGGWGVENQLWHIKACKSHTGKCPLLKYFLGVIGLVGTLFVLTVDNICSSLLGCVHSIGR